MDYEKLYKEALKKAEGIIKYYKGCNRDEASIEDLETIFPELKESEDERIRKTLVAIVNLYYGEGEDEEKTACLYWLEKQGEQKSTADNFESALKHIMEEAIECGDTRNLKADAEMLMRLVQKPAWSEEDETNLQGIIDEIQANKNNAPDYDIETYDRFLKWLKSLKERIGG